jgi:hypothetical protein
MDAKPRKSDLEALHEIPKLHARLSSLAHLAKPMNFPCLWDWAYSVLLKDGWLEDLICELRNGAEVVQGKLEILYRNVDYHVTLSDKLHSHMEEQGWFGDDNPRGATTLYRKGLFRDKVVLDYETERRLRSDIIPPVQAALSPLIETLNQLMPRRGKGKTRGHKDYPGLADLVYELEYFARRHGGGFTFHRSWPEKSTLIEALNLLRRRFADNPDGRRWASCLPAPDKHPTSTYESAVREARKNAKLARAKGGK